MAKFKMTDEIATILFVVKNDVLYWSHSEAVYEPIRGKRAGSLSNGYKATNAFGNNYATADLVHLIKHGEWPAYEDIVNSMAVLTARFKNQKAKPMSAEKAEMISIRIDALESALQERYENF